MKDLFVFESYEITSLTVNKALNKLAKGGVEAFNVKKINKNTIRLSVRAKDSQKFFAIFNGSCYTISRQKDKGLKKLVNFAVYRVGACIGVAVFLLTVFFSQIFVFKVEVKGSGSYYADEIKSLLKVEGVSFFSVYDKEKTERARIKVLNLPEVSFCSIQKNGNIIAVCVEVSFETPEIPPVKSLVSTKSGKLVQLVTIRGTPQFKEGDEILKGDTLVEGYELLEGGQKFEVSAIAKAIIECDECFEYVAKEKNEKSRLEAIAQAVLKIGDNEIIKKDVIVFKQGNSFVYRINIVYLAIIAVNMD